jgi:outer membrane protein assembly factor BamB
VVTRNRVYVVGTRGRVRSFDKSDGEVRWIEELFERIRHPPAVDSNHVYVGTEEGVYALRTSSGWVDWSFETEDAATAPSVGGNTVYVGDGGTLYALDAGTGKVNWRREIPGATSPAVTSDTLYVGTNFGLRALREERKLPDIDIADISVDSTEVGVDETVNITVELENTGEADGTFLVTLYVDGSAIDSEDTTVPSGETREIGFTVSFEEPGEKYLRISTKGAGTVTVIADETGSETETEADENVAEETEGTDDDESDDGFTPSDFGLEEAVAVTVTAFAVTAAAVAVKIARLRGKE